MHPDRRGLETTIASVDLRGVLVTRQHPAGWHASACAEVEHEPIAWRGMGRHSDRRHRHYMCDNTHQRNSRASVPMPAMIPPTSPAAGLDDDAIGEA